MMFFGLIVETKAEYATIFIVLDLVCYSKSSGETILSRA